MLRTRPNARYLAAYVRFDHVEEWVRIERHNSEDEHRSGPPGVSSAVELEKERSNADKCANSDGVVHFDSVGASDPEVKHEHHNGVTCGKEKLAEIERVSVLEARVGKRVPI